MVTMQRARDARIAERTLAGATRGGAVLIAGAGHVRRDRAVPDFLVREAPGRSVRAIAFLEVSAGRDSPGDYAQEYGASPLPFDFVGFTARAPRSDPCAGMKQKIRPLERSPADATWVRRSTPEPAAANPSESRARTSGTPAA
jgi:hypothetical protein